MEYFITWQQRLRSTCTNMQTHQSLGCLYTQNMDVDEGWGQKQNSGGIRVKATLGHFCTAVFPWWQLLHTMPPVIHGFHVAGALLIGSQMTCKASVFIIVLCKFNLNPSKWSMDVLPEACFARILPWNCNVLEISKMKMPGKPIIIMHGYLLLRNRASIGWKMSQLWQWNCLGGPYVY